MWLIIYWLLGLPSVLFHGFISVVVLISLICYKVFSSPASIATAASRKSLSTCCREQAALRQQQFKNKLSSLMSQARASASNRENQEKVSNASMFAHLNTNVSASPRKNGHHVALLATSLWIIVSLGLFAHQIECLEQDAQIMAPVANLAKGVIKTATLGVPLDVSFNPGGLAKNFAYFTWRTGFPVTMPSGFMQKAQDFYNRVRSRVNLADVKDVERKSLANLRLDLDEIVDSIVEQVRQSRDGLYTDYLQTRVAGLPLEDACTNVGIQLKAYGVDLTNYRNIAGAVLGIPVMPTVASAMVDVAGFAKPNLSRLTNFTQQHLPAGRFLSQLPGGAYSSMVSASGNVFNPIDNLARQLNPTNVVSPLGSIFNQAFRDPQTAASLTDGPVDKRIADSLSMMEPVY